MSDQPTGPLPDGLFNDRFGRSLDAVMRRLDLPAGGATMDVLFIAYLEAVARFGYVALGPITIDVRLIADLVERTAPRDPAAASGDFVRFSRLLMDEVRRSGQQHLDEAHYLYAFMRCNEGLPARVFGELGVTREEVERALRRQAGAGPPLEPLLTPEEVAEYLKVNVQTVRAWIRSGKLPARRVAGLRALRVRAADVTALLRPLDEPEERGSEAPAASERGSGTMRRDGVPAD
jgi:excisionase family DNA binding protein